MPQTDNERYFYDPNSKERARFPSILSAPSVYLSVIVPSYNEEARCTLSLSSHSNSISNLNNLNQVPIMLDKAFQYLQDRKVDFFILFSQIQSKLIELIEKRFKVLIRSDYSRRR